MRITLEEYLSLAIGYKDFAVVETKRKEEIASENPTDKPLAYIRPANAEGSLWQIWYVKAWLMSAERRQEVQAAAEIERSKACGQNEAKAMIIRKLKTSLGIGDHQTIMPILDILLANKEATTATLKQLGLTDEEIAIL